MNLFTKFKNLIVSGCSFTHNNHPETHCTWSNALAHWSGMNVINLAIPGAGNEHIKNSILLYLQTHEVDIESTLIIAMWSGPERIDWITDANNSNFADQYPFSYHYTDCNELVLGGSWWSNRPTTSLTRTLVDYSKYQSNSSLALQSWINIQDLDNYLKIHGYHYYFTSWFGYDSAVDQSNRWIEFDTELKKLGLKRNLEQWIVDHSDRCLGNWIHARPEYLMDDKLHPTWQGHEAWLKEILIPELIQRGCVTLL
jgi:hypothetical protein